MRTLLAIALLLMTGPASAQDWTVDYSVRGDVSQATKFYGDGSYELLLTPNYVTVYRHQTDWVFIGMYLQPAAGYPQADLPASFPAITFTGSYDTAVVTPSGAGGGGGAVVGVPLPLLITPSEAMRGALRRLSPPLQYITAAGATAVLRTLGMPARLRPGLGDYGEYQAYVDLRWATVQVMDGCNGLGFILTLGIGALLLGAQVRRGAWLVALTLPLALAANALRVAMLSAGVERWGVGWMTWSLALVALMGLAMLMARRRPAD